MEKESDFKSMLYDIQWWLKTRCTNWAVNLASIDWGKTDRLMYERHQFQDFLDYFTKEQGWSPTLMIERGYHMEVTFNANDQVVDIRNRLNGYGLPHIRLAFKTGIGYVTLHYTELERSNERGVEDTLRQLGTQAQRMPCGVRGTSDNERQEGNVVIDSSAIISMYRHHHDQLRRCRDNADTHGIIHWQQRIEDLEVISTYYGWSVRPSTDGHTHIRLKLQTIEVALWN